MRGIEQLSDQQIMEIMTGHADQPNKHDQLILGAISSLKARILAGNMPAKRIRFRMHAQLCEIASMLHDIIDELFKEETPQPSSIGLEAFTEVIKWINESDRDPFNKSLQLGWNASGQIGQLVFTRINLELEEDGLDNKQPYDQILTTDQILDGRCLFPLIGNRDSLAITLSMRSIQSTITDRDIIAGAKGIFNNENTRQRTAINPEWGRGSEGHSELPICTHPNLRSVIGAHPRETREAIVKCWPYIHPAFWSIKELTPQHLPLQLRHRNIISDPASVITELLPEMNPNQTTQALKLARKSREFHQREVIRPGAADIVKLSYEGNIKSILHMPAAPNQREWGKIIGQIQEQLSPQQLLNLLKMIGTLENRETPLRPIKLYQLWWSLIDEGPLSNSSTRSLEHHLSSPEQWVIEMLQNRQERQLDQAMDQLLQLDVAQRSSIRETITELKMGSTIL